MTMRKYRPWGEKRCATCKFLNLELKGCATGESSNPENNHTQQFRGATNNPCKDWVWNIPDSPVVDKLLGNQK
jgi:hypothetical protein